MSGEGSEGREPIESSSNDNFRHEVSDRKDDMIARKVAKDVDNNIVDESSDSNTTSVHDAGVSVAFGTWLDEHGAITGRNCVLDSNLRFGRGLAAKRDIFRGEVLVAIPENLLITPDQVLRDPLHPLFPYAAKFPGDELLILILLHEWSRGNASFFKDYIDSLPSSYYTPHYWSEQDHVLLQNVFQDEISDSRFQEYSTELNSVVRVAERILCSDNGGLSQLLFGNVFERLVDAVSKNSGNSRISTNYSNSDGNCNTAVNSNSIIVNASADISVRVNSDSNNRNSSISTTNYFAGCDNIAVGDDSNKFISDIRCDVIAEAKYYFFNDNSNDNSSSANFTARDFFLGAVLGKEEAVTRDMIKTTTTTGVVLKQQEQDQKLQQQEKNEYLFREFVLRAVVWAHGSVWTRGCYFRTDKSKNQPLSCLVPFGDLLNYHPAHVDAECGLVKDFRDINISPVDVTSGSGNPRVVVASHNLPEEKSTSAPKNRVSKKKGSGEKSKKKCSDTQNKESSNLLLTVSDDDDNNSIKIAKKSSAKKTKLKRDGEKLSGTKVIGDKVEDEPSGTTKTVASSKSSGKKTVSRRKQAKGALSNKDEDKPQQQAVMLSNSSKLVSDSKGDNNKSYYVFRAGKFTKKGTECFICYGQKSNFELLLNYGFALANSPFDSVQLDFATNFLKKSSSTFANSSSIANDAVQRLENIVLNAASINSDDSESIGTNNSTTNNNTDGCGTNICNTTSSKSTCDNICYGRRILALIAQRTSGGILTNEQQLADEALEMLETSGEKEQLYAQGLFDNWYVRTNWSCDDSNDTENSRTNSAEKNQMIAENNITDSEQPEVSFSLETVFRVLFGQAEKLTVEDVFFQGKVGSDELEARIRNKLRLFLQKILTRYEDQILFSYCAYLGVLANTTESETSKTSVIAEAALQKERRKPRFELLNVIREVLDEEDDVQARSTGDAKRTRAAAIGSGSSSCCCGIPNLKSMTPVEIMIAGEMRQLQRVCDFLNT